jgi:hypothetical protein
VIGTRFRVQRSETGASLIIAMALVTLISVALVAALGFASASLKTVTVISDQRAAAYSADGSVETAIQALRYNATAGTTAVGSVCPPVAYASAGSQPAAAVTCSVAASGSASGPNAVMPPYAIWAVGNSAAETGVKVTTGTLKVNGPVASNSPATGAGAIDSVSGALDVSGSTLDATGTCPGSITVTSPADKRCSTGSTFPDPGYPSQPIGTLGAPNPSPTCTVTSGVLQFAPGYYTNTAPFEAPVYLQGGNTCKTGYLYFKPGVYYFDFGFDPLLADAIWNVPAGQVIVGGEYKGWNPSTANSVPAAPGGGSSVACKTGTDGATSGVQFVFGGASQMVATTLNDDIELCASPSPTGTNQQIAIYGQPTGASPSPQTATNVPTTATPTPATGWTNLPANVLPIGASTTPIDTQIASYTMPSAAGGSTDTVTLGGYAGAAATIPAGSINVTYALEVAHQETVSNANFIGALTATIGTCALTPTKHNTNALTAPVTDSIPITTAACIAAVQGSFSVAYKLDAPANKSFIENLDGIRLVITYTPPAVRAESGCVTVVNSCALLTLGSNGVKSVIWGTVDAPLASVAADDSSSSVIEFRRAVVARAVSIANLPAGDSTGSFCQGGGAPCVGWVRVLLFTSTVSGKIRVRSLVRYTDTPALGTAVQVLAWNVVR